MLQRYRADMNHPASWLLPSAVPDGDRPVAEATSRATRVVLYVEDDPLNAMLMQGIVELRPGFALRVARSGAEALGFVALQRVDLLLCDLGLPDGPGDALLPQLRQAGLPAAVPALLVTAESADVAADVARRGGFDGHWTKPLDVLATLRGLERWLGTAAEAGT